MRLPPGSAAKGVVCFASKRSSTGSLVGIVAAAVVGASHFRDHFLAPGIDKLVVVSVDGKQKAISTSASDVAGVLKDAGYTVSAHDTVAPAPAAPLSSGSQIVLNRGRLLNLQVNGKPKDVWTTAATVDVALTQLGYTPAVYTSVARSTVLPLGVTAIVIRTPKPVVVVADGKKRNVTTTEATVAGVLSTLGVKLEQKDRVKPALTAHVKIKTRIVITRVKNGKLTVTEAVAYPVTQKPDAKMTVNQRKVLRAGVQGSAKVTYAVTYVNGKVTKRTVVARKVVTKPKAQIVKVGTKPLPQKRLAAVAAAPAATAGGGASPQEAMTIALKVVRARGWKDSAFNCLAQIWGHESGWRVNAGSAGGTYGIPQANPGSKMASAGADWQTNARTQINWGLSYIVAKFGTPCGAWDSWQIHGWY